MAAYSRRWRAPRVAVRAAAAGAAGAQREQQRRVVVTGMGVVSPLGHDPDTFYDNLLEGRSGISLIESFDTSERRSLFGFPFFWSHG